MSETTSTAVAALPPSAVPFFAIPNLSSHDVRQITEPWNTDVSAAPWHLTKEEWSAWTTKPSTEHCFISLVEGAMSGVRVAKEANEACLLHGFVADYDSSVEMADALRAVMGKARPSPYKPAYCVQTFSGHLRLVWLFERPLPVLGNAHARRFYVKLAAELRAPRFFGGLDDSSMDRNTSESQSWIRSCGMR